MNQFLSTAFDVFYNNSTNLSITTDQLLILSESNDNYYSLVFKVQVDIYNVTKNEILNNFQKEVRNKIKSEFGEYYIDDIYSFIFEIGIEEGSKKINGLEFKLLFRKKNEYVDYKQLDKEIIYLIISNFDKLKLLDCNEIRLYYKDFQIDKVLGKFTIDDLKTIEE